MTSKKDIKKLPGGRETSLGTQFLVRPGSCREHNPWRGVFCCGHHNKREEGGLECFSRAVTQPPGLYPPTVDHVGARFTPTSLVATCCPWPSPFRLVDNQSCTPIASPPVRRAHARAGVCLNATAIKTREEGGLYFAVLGGRAVPGNRQIIFICSKC
jgi:hypothetical protein